MYMAAEALPPVSSCGETAAALPYPAGGSSAIEGAIEAGEKRVNSQSKCNIARVKAIGCIKSGTRECNVGKSASCSE